MLGKLIVHETKEQILVGKIVETEAYQGGDDQAAHSFKNLRTKRTDIMFKDPGRVYCYQMHTHVLINVVAGPPETPHAILIRAVEPLDGLDQMILNRSHIKNKFNLTNGPGKLTKAMDISMAYYGHHWSKKPLYISKGIDINDSEIQTSSRIGIANSGEAAHYPWRFFLKDNPYVSNYRK